MSRRVPTLAPNAAVLGAFTDARLLGRAFGGPSFRLWRAIVAGIFGEPCPADTDPAEVLALVGRASWPEAPCREFWGIAGRRSGKSAVLAGIAVAVAALRDYRPHLAPGERATVMLIAGDKRQARVLHRYVVGLLEASPLLRPLVETVTRERVDLSNRCSVEVHIRSFRALRGYAVSCAVLDELGFWLADETSANPAVEVLNALRPAMVSLPQSLLLVASSPHQRQGPLYKTWRRSRSDDADPDVLCLHAETRTLNPTIGQRVIDRALADDPERASAEWLAAWRADLESFLSADQIERVTSPGRLGLPPIPDVRYTAFVDAAGGSGKDSMTWAIAHAEGDRAVLDHLAEQRPPFSPDATVADVVADLRRYRCSSVTGDRYAAEWVSEAFRQRGVHYQPASRPKSDLYQDFMPLVNAGRVELLDVGALRAQLLNLERRVVRGGRSAIDHPPGGRDDLANSAAGACVLAASRPAQTVGVMSAFWIA